VANGYFVGTNNRVGKEAPWNIGEFYGKSYFCDPRGNILAQASRDKDELVVADCDLEMIEAVRMQWQFYRDRRPELYGPLGRVQK
jgi:beta-ureidopropionase